MEFKSVEWGSERQAENIQEIGIGIRGHRARAAWKTRGLGRKENGRTGTGYKAQERDSGKGSRNPRDKKGVKGTGVVVEGWGVRAVFQGQGVGIQGAGKGPKAQRWGVARDRKGVQGTERASKGWGPRHRVGGRTGYSGAGVTGM